MIDIGRRFSEVTEAMNGIFTSNEGKLRTITGVKSQLSLVPTGIGCFRIDTSDGSFVARFAIQFFPNCGAVAILCDAEVSERFRNKGLATLLHSMRMDACRRAGASVILATVQAGNAFQLSIMRRYGYNKVMPEFVNNRTENTLILFSLTL